MVDGTSKHAAREEVRIMRNKEGGERKGKREKKKRKSGASIIANNNKIATKLRRNKMNVAWNGSRRKDPFLAEWKRG